MPEVVWRFYECTSCTSVEFQGATWLPEEKWVAPYRFNHKCEGAIHDHVACPRCGEPATLMPVVRAPYVSEWFVDYSQMDGEKEFIDGGGYE